MNLRAESAAAMWLPVKVKKHPERRRRRIKARSHFQRAQGAFCLPSKAAEVLIKEDTFLERWHTSTCLEPGDKIG